MARQVGGAKMSSEGAIPFATNRTSNDPDQLDAAGQSIVQLLHKAAGVAEANSRQALQMAQKISDQVRAAEERIAASQAEADAYRQRSERAEEWLRRVYVEIEDRFLRRANGLGPANPRGS
jgi:hypothetical protein